MTADPPPSDPTGLDPRDEALRERSDTPTVSPWLVIGGILMLGAAVYVVSALV